MRKLLLGAFAWMAAITIAHLFLNVDWRVVMNDRLPDAQRKLNVAYVPVT